MSQWIHELTINKYKLDFIYSIKDSNEFINEYQEPTIKKIRMILFDIFDLYDNVTTIRTIEIIKLILEDKNIDTQKKS